MNYEAWLKEVPVEIKGDPLWTVEAYRLALFATDLGWHDVTKLIKDKRTLELSDQLYSALGSVGANVSEAILARAAKIGLAFMSMAWARHGNVAAGITMAGMSLAKRLPNIAFASSPK